MTSSPALPMCKDTDTHAGTAAHMTAADLHRARVHQIKGPRDRGHRPDEAVRPTNRR